MRRTREQRIADMEAEAAQLKRKLRMETVPGVKEATVIAKALHKWNAEHGLVFDDENNIVLLAAQHLESLAEEPK